MVVQLNYSEVFFSTRVEKNSENSGNADYAKKNYFVKFQQQGLDRIRELFVFSGSVLKRTLPTMYRKNWFSMLNAEHKPEKMKELFAYRLPYRTTSLLIPCLRLHKWQFFQLNPLGWTTKYRIGFTPNILQSPGKILLLIRRENRNIRNLQSGPVFYTYLHFMWSKITYN
jgi:hypothetical protein